MPFNVFLSSPVYGIKDYRETVVRTAMTMERRMDSKIKFHFYENYEIHRSDDKTICESIFETIGVKFDAFYIFFRERVGQGTIDELDYFENHLRAENPACELWWSEISCSPDKEPDADVVTMLSRLNRHNLGLQSATGETIIKSKEDLGFRFLGKVTETSERLGSG